MTIGATNLFIYLVGESRDIFSTRVSWNSRKKGVANINGDHVHTGAVHCSAAKRTYRTPLCEQEVGT